MRTSQTTFHLAKWPILAVALMLGACETMDVGAGSKRLDKNALSEELKKETYTGVSIPPDCSTLTTSLPPGKASVTVSYQEPTTNQKGIRLTELAYTTIYTSSSDGQTQAIHIWTNDAHGGAFVTVHNIPVTTQKLGFCVTATNWSRKESPPALPNKPKPETVKRAQ